MLAKSASQPQSTHKAADRDYKDQDEDPLAGSDQGLKKRKMSKDAEPSKGSKSKESKSTSSSKGTKPYKPLPLIEDRGRQVVPTDYFINNDLEYLKGGSSSRKYMTSTTRTKVAKYDNIEGIEDMTLTSIRIVLHNIASNLEMDYLPKQRWCNLEKKRSCIMIKAVDKLLFERRLMQNLERFVSGRDYRTDLRLLERTI
ncbi:hypothetical protein Tco_1279679 [Tanacetum coccineum]